MEPGPVINRVSTNARFRIECARGMPPGLSPHLCAKGYFGEDARPFRPIGEPEAHFYRDLAESTGVRTLRSVYADIDPTTRHGVVITEDVVAQGAVFLEPGSDYSPDNVAESLEQLAVLHAATWSKKAYEALPWLISPLELIAGGRGVDVIRGNFDGPIGAGVPAELRDAERLHRLYPTLVAESARATPWTVLHGDAHVGNLFLDGAGRPGFLDWQLVHRGPWFLDVGYHLASTMPADDRRRHEIDLLRHHLDRRLPGESPRPRSTTPGERSGAGSSTGLTLGDHSKGGSSHHCSPAGAARHSRSRSPRTRRLRRRRRTLTLREAGVPLIRCGATECRPGPGLVADLCQTHFPDFGQ